MIRDRAPIFLALSDLLFCLLIFVLVAVSPAKSKTDGVKPKAEFLIQMDYPVDYDTDLDLWLVGPDHKPVFYQARQQGCASLDRDSLGNRTSLITLDDGTVVREVSNRETISLRCLNPGRYDVAVNLYSDREMDKGKAFIPFNVEIIGLNPSVNTIFTSHDLSLKHIGQSQNVVSFTLDKDGTIKLVDVPLEPVTDVYSKP